MRRRKLCTAWAVLAVLAASLTSHARADEPTSRRADEPKKVALLVGVNRYQARKLIDRPLSFAERDVVELGEVLKKQGFEVRVLTGAAATKEGIDRAVKAVLTGRKGTDLVVLGFSGHGVELPMKDEAGKVVLDDRKRPLSDAYFCPVDAVFDDGSTMIGLTDLLGRIDARGGGFNLLLVDACRDAPPDPNRGVRSFAGDDLNGRIPRDSAVFFSCSSGQQAIETDKAGGGHGIFFHHVIEGLRGKAADAESGEVAWDDLVSFVRKNVNRQARLWEPDRARRADERTPGSLQTPHVLANTIANPVLARVDRDRKPAEAPDFAASIGIKIVPIPQGSFLMGTSPEAVEKTMKLVPTPGGKEEYDDEQPRHEVRITKLRGISAHEITVGQFRRFVEDEGYRTGAETDGKGGWGFDPRTKDSKQDPGFTWRSTGFPQSDDHPVVNVTWIDAVKFCRWLSRKDGRTYRLPTEAEWEYANRAGSRSETLYVNGDDPEGLVRIANVADAAGTKVAPSYFEVAIKGNDGFAFTAPVGRYQPNAWGLYDMHGNVTEWCLDVFDIDYYKESPPVDPCNSALAGPRVARGGSWEDSASVCRTSSRPYYRIDLSNYSLGFRVARVTPGIDGREAVLSSARRDARQGRRFDRAIRTPTAARSGGALPRPRGAFAKVQGGHPENFARNPESLRGKSSRRAFPPGENVQPRRRSRRGPTRIRRRKGTEDRGRSPMTRRNLAIAAWCGLAIGGTATALAEEPKDLARQARVVLKRYCDRCHHGAGSEGGEFDVARQADLLSKEFYDPSLVVAGKPEASYLFERVAKNQMPPRNVPERPGDAEKEAIRKWIEAGAPAFPDDSAKRTALKLADVLKAARDHLLKASADDREYLRFFTLHVMANNPAVSDDDLKLARAALSKAINSLSREPRIVVPVAVDAAKTLFAVDIRDLGWDKGRRWLAVERAYPFGLKYDDFPDQNLRSIDAELTRLTDCSIPMIRGDWFVATAARPPLYHELLGLPTDAKALERELGVDIAASFLRPRPEKIARAGFRNSGVSAQNRMVERLETKDGIYYWKSRDYKPNNGRANLVRFPLGPLDLFPPGKHPFRDQAFAHDGGEIIFGLPNGLQAYLLVDGKDGRIDVGPIDVVHDAQPVLRSPEIFNGLSCMSCHKTGMKPFADTIRETSAVFGEAEAKVRQLYVEKAVMDDLLQRDEARFLAALEKAIGPFLREGSDASAPIARFDEPVGVVARAYETVALNLRDIARELDLDDAKAISEGVGKSQLKQLGLEELLGSGTITRQEWEAKLNGASFRLNGLSLMQQLALELRYTPVVPR